MDATKLLESQHREVERLFKQYEKANDAGTKQQLFEAIADDLAAHCEIEEKVFYPSVYVGELKDKLREAVEEHLGAKRIIADLLKMSAEDEEFDAKMKVLQEQIDHHVEEEETEIFPKVRRQFVKDELSGMGEQMQTMFDGLKEQEPRNQVPSETDEAAPLP